MDGGCVLGVRYARRVRLCSYPPTVTFAIRNDTSARTFGETCCPFRYTARTGGPGAAYFASTGFTVPAAIASPAISWLTLAIPSPEIAATSNASELFACKLPETVL